jgi:hypothetical protein
VQEEQEKECPLTTRRNRHGTSSVEDLERPQNPELHGSGEPNSVD